MQVQWIWIFNMDIQYGDGQIAMIMAQWFAFGANVNP
jgi:hypothetical protein